MAKKNKHVHIEETKSPIKIIQKNKRAYHEYEILDTFECGLILLGAEVKSIRENKVQFADSFAKIKGNRLFLHNMHISHYKFYTEDPIDPIRIRELLVHKEEINKMRRQVEEKGRSLVPISLYLKRGLVKIEIGVGRGKKLHDKKDTLKQKNAERDAQREIKSFFKEK